MSSLSPLLVVQLTLIAVGLLFQFVAFSFLRKEGRSCSESGPRQNAEAFQLHVSPRRSRPSARTSRDRAHDYYEMEKTPPGLRPAELPKTAKVSYFDGSKPPAV